MPSTSKSIQAPARVRAVILDIDGTLIDSNHQHARSWIEAMREAGLRANPRDVENLIGKGGDKLLPEATGVSEKSARGRRISERRGKLFRSRFMGTLRPFTGVRELLQELRSRGVKLVVGTSASKKDMAGLLDRLGIEDLLDEKVSKEDAGASKPDPDIVEAALEKAGVAPEEALMLGDTPYDIEAASRAGVRTIGVLSGGRTLHDLRQAACVYSGPAGVLRALRRGELDWLGIPPVPRHRDAKAPLVSLLAHNVVDSVHGLTVASLPFALGFARVPEARRTCLALGVGVIGYSALTNYRYSLAKVIPLGPHMALDVSGGLALMAAPFALGYRPSLRPWQLAAHFALGLGAIVAVVLTRPRTERERERYPDDRDAKLAVAA